MMRLMSTSLPASLLAAALAVGCSGNPSSPGPGSEDPSSGLGAFDLKERFSLDTGLKDRDGKPAGITGIAVSADGKILLAMATGPKKGNVQVWDLEKRKQLYQYNNDIYSMLPVVISSDGKWGAYPTQVAPTHIALIDLTSGKEVRKLEKKGDTQLDFYSKGLVFSPKGDLLIVGAGTEIIGWNPTTGEERFVWGVTDRVTALSGVFDDGKKIASGTEKGSLKVWDIATGKVVQTLAEGGKKGIDKLFLSTDGKHLGMHEAYGRIKVWDLATGKVEKDSRGDQQPGAFSSMQFLPGNRIVAYNGDWALILQDTATSEQKNFDEGRTVRQYPVAVTQDGSTLISGKEDGKIRVWDLKPPR